MGSCAVLRRSVFSPPSDSPSARGECGLEANLARRCFGPALRTNGPLGRNRRIAFRAKGPSILKAWAKAISVGPGNRAPKNAFEAQRAGHSDVGQTTHIERLGRWPATTTSRTANLARRCALDQAMRTYGPLGRNRNLQLATDYRSPRQITGCVASRSKSGQFC